MRQHFQLDQINAGASEEAVMTKIKTIADVEDSAKHRAMHLLTTNYTILIDAILIDAILIDAI